MECTGTMAEQILKEVTAGIQDFFQDDGEYDNKKSDNDYGDKHPFSNLEKAAVLQDARIFHDSEEVKKNSDRCCTILGQLVYLCQSHALNQVEATEVFFSSTKLFVSKDACLRRLLYLLLKEVYVYCDPGDVIIVTSSLTKDMTCDEELYRSNALRVLVRIMDSSMLPAVERYIKQALVHKSSNVASSALVSSLRLLQQQHHFSDNSNAAIVKRWIGEVQQATSSPSPMVQYHAIQLLYLIKAQDRLGVCKLVQQFSNRRSFTSPLALVVLARFTAKLIHNEIYDGRSPLGSISNASPFVQSGYAFLRSSLHHPSELLVFEAARAICQLPGCEPQDINPAISALQLFLTHPKPTTRYATLKVLANLANTYPRIVSKCNDELEAIMSGANRSLATLAITTLFKTGNEAGIDRLLKQTTTFFHEIGDEYKIAIVTCIQDLCFTYPHKHRLLVGAMTNFLRGEGGFQFKKTIIDSIVTLIRAVPETTQSSLLQLCEYIEDCEYPALNTQILHLLGELGPSTHSPAKYIRFVHNRIMLEKAEIRAASVSVLAKFGASCPSLRSSILVLLKRSRMDEDDETRDRAANAVAILQEAMDKFPYIPPSYDNDDEYLKEEETNIEDEPCEDDTAAYCLLNTKMPMSISKLEHCLQAYLNTPGAMDSNESLQFMTLPIVEDAEPTSTSNRERNKNKQIMSSSSSAVNSKKMPVIDAAADIYAIPELASLGRVFRSCPAVELSESETEYVAICIKHIMDEYVILQFKIENTIDDQRLTNVSVALESNDGDTDQLYEVTGEIPAESIKYGEIASSFTVLKRNVDQPIEASTWNCTLHFGIVQIDPTTGEDASDAFEEEYPLEDFEITSSDFMAKISVPDFRNAWETMGNTNEVVEKFALSHKNIENAINAVVKCLGMQTCDGTGTVKSGKSHMLHLSGTFVGGKSVLVRAQIAIQGDSGGCVLKMVVRSDDERLSRIVADCIS